MVVRYYSQLAERCLAPDREQKEEGRTGAGVRVHQRAAWYISVVAAAVVAPGVEADRIARVQSDCQPVTGAHSGSAAQTRGDPQACSLRVGTVKEALARAHAP